MTVARRFIITAAIVLVLAGAALISVGFTFPHEQPLKEIGRYRATVEKGRYLATAANCATCHTAKGGQPFAGGLEFQTPFGVLYSTNITMDKKTGIGNWTLADFYRAMKHGIRPNGAYLYPAFPYTAFAKMADDDIASLYLFVKTIKPVTAPAKPNALRFPYNLRSLLGVWNILFHNPDSYVPDPTRSAAWNRGAYLVSGPGHCGACHTPRNLLGAERGKLALTGGVLFDDVLFDNRRQWSAVNLTSSPTGLAAWSAADIVAYLKTGVSKRAVVHGPMTEVVMNSTRHLADADLLAIATYLKDISPNAQNSARAANAKARLDGENVYTVHCGSCHLPTGNGDDQLGVPLVSSALVQAPNPSSLINVILYGPLLPPRPFVVERSAMKMYGKRLSDQDVADVATYLRSSFNNNAGAVTPEQVAVQR